MFIVLIKLRPSLYLLSLAYSRYLINEVVSEEIPSYSHIYSLPSPFPYKLISFSHDSFIVVVVVCSWTQHVF